MDPDQDAQQRRVPTLVQLCQRGKLVIIFMVHILNDFLLAASAHVDCVSIIYWNKSKHNSWKFCSHL